MAVDPETANLLLVAQLVIAAALARDGEPWRPLPLDYPDRDAARDDRHTLLVPGALQERVGEVETAVSHA